MKFSNPFYVYRQTIILKTLVLIELEFRSGSKCMTSGLSKSLNYKQCSIVSHQYNSFQVVKRIISSVCYKRNQILSYLSVNKPKKYYYDLFQRSKKRVKLQRRLKDQKLIFSI